jgi:plasmid stabilization system protein ParE
MSGYRLTESAEADLVDILTFIADRDGYDRALHVHERFLDAFEALAASPGIGNRKPHLTPEAVRWWPVFQFLVVYDAERTPIDILRVLHGARDLARLFEG